MAGVRKGRGRELGRETTREGGGRRGTPARKPLFLPSCLLIKKSDTNMAAGFIVVVHRCGGHDVMWKRSRFVATGRARITRDGKKMLPLLFCPYARVVEISPFALKSRLPQRRLSLSTQTFFQLSLKVTSLLFCWRKARIGGTSAFAGYQILWTRS